VRRGFDVCGTLHLPVRLATSLTSIGRRRAASPASQPASPVHTRPQSVRRPNRRITGEGTRCSPPRRCWNGRLWARHVSVVISVCCCSQFSCPPCLRQRRLECCLHMYCTCSSHRDLASCRAGEKKKQTSIRMRLLFRIRGILFAKRKEVRGHR